MRSNDFRRKLIGLAVATALGAAVSPVAAAPYRGYFDPIDFSGEYVVDVNPSCLAQSDGWYANAGLCAATLSSASALVTSTAPDPVYSGTLTFAPPAISSAGTLFGLYVAGGKLDSLDTSLIYFNGASPATADNWWIQFVSGHMPPPPPCYYCYGPVINMVDVEVIDPSLNGVYLYVNTTGSPSASAEYLGPAERVPEPGTLALAVGGLAGGLLARRRRTKEEIPDPD